MTIFRAHRPLIILFFGAALVGGSIWVFYSVLIARQTFPQAIAEAIAQECAKESDHAACFERRIPDLYGTYSVHQLFEIVRVIRREDPTYQFCHVLAHKIGERVVAEDPSRWFEALRLNPVDGLCSNGFIHGIIVGRFRSAVLDDATMQKLVPDFVQACESQRDWDPSDLEKAMCYHGLGHLYTFITSARLEKALGLCDATTKGANTKFLGICFGGVFMQIFQPLEPEDFALLKQLPYQITADNYRHFCSRFGGGEREGACLREAWPLKQAMILNGTGAQSFCSGMTDAQASECYETISAIIGRLSLDNTPQAIAACKRFPAAQQLTCFSASAEAVLEEDRTRASTALALCSAAPGDIADDCLKTLARRAHFIFGGELQQFCSQMPSKFQTECFHAP